MPKQISLDDVRCLTIAQFCELEDMTLEEFEELATEGVSPITFSLAELPEYDLSKMKRRITPEARREWHERIANAYYGNE